MHIRDFRSDIDAIDAYPAFITRDYFTKNFEVINAPTRSSTSVKSLGHLRVKNPYKVPIINQFLSMKILEFRKIFD